MNSRAVLPLLFLVALLPAVGCDKATPVAPDGAILTISANPSQVALNGRSTITVVGRKPDGQPLNPGTEIRLTAERGTIESIVTTDSQGRATATFRADGRTGEVKVTASTGGGDTMAETTVQVGVPDTDRPDLRVSVTPNIIPVGGEAEVTVIARNADGTPASPGQTVILTTTLGELENNRPRTQADGTAVTTLIAGDQAGSAEITAILGSSEPATTEVTIRDFAAAISLQVIPASIPRDDNDDIRLVASVANAQGEPVQGVSVSFTTEVGTIEPAGFVLTNSSGIAEATLSVLESQLGNRDSFTVTATVTTGNGERLTDTVEVDID